MKRFCVIVVSVISVFFLCSSTLGTWPYEPESKVTVTYGSMSCTTSLESAELVYKAFPFDFQNVLRQALCDIGTYEWFWDTVCSGKYEDVYYEFNGPEKTFICKYKNASIKADNITGVDLVRIFELEID